MAAHQKNTNSTITVEKHALNMEYTSDFFADCCKCKRMVALRHEVKARHPHYHALPVAPFGDNQAKLLIVGLAPGMHGANRTGRPFTGDHAGEILYRTLHQYGYANKSISVDANDGLDLIACRITNAVKCLPPQNKPLPDEITVCNGYLRAELAQATRGTAILALGQIAHQAILMGYGLKRKDYKFGHGQNYVLPNAVRLFDSYHCSRYNTQTRRLTAEMFERVFDEIASYLQHK
jgi:uracil-DNA glycosylase